MIAAFITAVKARAGSQVWARPPQRKSLIQPTMDVAILVIGAPRCILPFGAVMSGIDQWLKRLGLEQYAALFSANHIDYDVLPSLTERDLEGLGISLGHRRKILKAIAKSLPTLPMATPTSAPARTQMPERRQLTVMFSDLVDSTELSRRLDPEDLGDVMRAYQNCCNLVVAKYDGMVARYLGDGIVIYFGYPRAHEDDAERAVRAGLDLVREIARIPSGMGSHLMARIGIATGTVVVGELAGIGAAQEQAVLGETPTLSARLQTVAEPGTVVIAAATRRLLGGIFLYQDLGGQKLKGFTEAVPAWMVIGDAGTKNRFEARHGTVLTPLIGREYAVRMLLDRWNEASLRSGKVVLISGEPGIGKSRIVHALREWLHRDSYVSLRYDCSPYHRNSALYPFIVQLEQAAGLIRDEPPDKQLQKLERLLASSAAQAQDAVPLLAALLSIPINQYYPPLNLTPQRQKERLLATLVTQLEGLTLQGRLLMIVEDAHWMDPTSLELLILIVERVKDLPVLLIITARPEFPSPWVAAAHVSSLMLDRLSSEQSADIVGHLAGNRTVSQDIVKHIVTRAEGVPLYVEELTLAVLESAPGPATVRSVPVGYTTAAVPSSLHDSLMARLDRVPSAKEVAQIAAVIGRDVSYQTLAAVADMPDAVLTEALEQLVAGQIMTCQGVTPHATFSFKHALMQDAAYESLLRSRRQQLHARTAAMLEQRSLDLAQAEPEILARHFTHAGMLEKAIAYWNKAAQRAAERSTHLEAIESLKKALRIIETLPAGPNKVRHQLSSLLALGGSLQEVTGPSSPETEETYVRARELSLQVGNARERFAASWGLWRVHNMRMKISAADALANELLSFAQEDKSPAVRLQAHHALWSTHYEAGDLEMVLEHVKLGLVLYDPEERQSSVYLLGGHDPAVCGLGIRAEALWRLGFPIQAATAINEVLALARKLDHPSSLAFALSYVVHLYLLVRLPERLRLLCQEMIALATEHGFASHLALATFGTGWALAALGRSREGIHQMRSGLDRMRATRQLAGERYLQALLAEALCKAGCIDEARRIVEEELIVSTDADARHDHEVQEGEVYRLCGEVLASDLTQPSAEFCFRRAVEISHGQRAKSLELRGAVSLARLWREQGRRVEARAALEPIYESFTEGLDTPDLMAARNLLVSLKESDAPPNTTEGTRDALRSAYREDGTS
jgi:class 3 adenylate cyclase/tetratricopeptide (TPR) repeat protein